MNQTNFQATRPLGETHFEPRMTSRIPKPIPTKSLVLAKIQVNNAKRAKKV